MFEKKLYHIKKLLNDRNESNELLTRTYIAKRLNKILIAYMSDLEHRIKYLEQCKPENVLKRL